LGGAGSYPAAINSAGQVAGEANTASGAGHAFLYSSGMMTDLGTLPGYTDTYSYATALNDFGQVVGTLEDSGGNFHSFLWQSGTGMTDLGTLGGSAGTGTGPQAVNNPVPGVHPVQVVGQGVIASGSEHAWLWQNGVMTDLNTLLPANSGWDLASANGINDDQQIAGFGVHNGQTHAFLWQIGGGVPTDLGTLAGDSDVSYADAINKVGQVVGRSSTAQDPIMSFLWTPSQPNGPTGTMTALPSLPRDPATEAFGMNCSTKVQVVGNGEFSGAIVWKNGKVIDLNNQIPKNSGWSQLQFGTGVNDAGDIVGQGYLTSGPHHAFLLIPTIKASSLMIAATGSQATGQIGKVAPATADRDLPVGFTATLQVGTVPPSTMVSISLTNDPARMAEAPSMPRPAGGDSIRFALPQTRSRETSTRVALDDLFARVEENSLAGPLQENLALFIIR